MSTSRLRSEWDQSSLIVAAIINSNPYRKGSAVQPDQFNPYRKAPAARKPDITISIKDLLPSFGGKSKW
jgi:hypothetical protein